MRTVREQLLIGLVSFVIASAFMVGYGLRALQCDCDEPEPAAADLEHLAQPEEHDA